MTSRSPFSERQSHLKQDELREEAKELQKLILEKNNEVEDREVRPSCPLGVRAHKERI